MRLRGIACISFGHKWEPAEEIHETWATLRCRRCRRLRKLFPNSVDAETWRMRRGRIRTG
jgi:hypothetical protein